MDKLVLVLEQTVVLVQEAAPAPVESDVVRNIFFYLII